MQRQGLAVWALEPYFGGSHKAFLQGLAERSSHAFTLFTLPGRNWKWRMHGGALSLAEQVLQRRAAGRGRHQTCSSPRTCSTCLCSWRR